MSSIYSLLPLSILQAILLAGGQVLVKIALQHMPKVEWSWSFVWSQATNWWWLACGISFGGATVLWAYILKHYPFSLAYPMSSMAYIFGMIAAMLIFHEQISTSAWVGICLIMLGCYFIAH